MDFSEIAHAAQLQKAGFDDLDPLPANGASSADVSAFEQNYFPPVANERIEVNQIDKHPQTDLPTPQDLLRTVLQDAMSAGEAARSQFQQLDGLDASGKKLTPDEAMAEALAVMESVFEWGVQTQLMTQTTNKAAKFIETLIKGQ